MTHRHHLGNTTGHGHTPAPVRDGQGVTDQQGDRAVGVPPTRHQRLGDVNVARARLSEAHAAINEVLSCIGTYGPKLYAVGNGAAAPVDIDVAWLANDGLAVLAGAFERKHFGMGMGTATGCAALARSSSTAVPSGSSTRTRVRPRSSITSAISASLLESML